MKYRKLSALALSGALIFSMGMTASAAPAAPDSAQDAGNNDIVILHTNDVHCAIDNAIGYAGVAAYKAEMEAIYGEDRVTLVDAGDAIQGGAIGTLSKGAFLVDIMNQTGYDIAVPGNHEFDYGMENFLTLAKERADYQYICANFIDLSTGVGVFPPYKIIDYGDTQIAYIGIDTPESFTKSTPAYFQDEHGNYIYNFCQGNDGADLYNVVQLSVDSARSEGADYVIAVGHLGTEGSYPEWQSASVLGNTAGIDAFIDGHSHEAYSKTVKNKVGKDVLLVQTGSKLNAIGKLVIDPDTGKITDDLITDYETKEPVTAQFIAALQEGFAGILDQVVAQTEVSLSSSDPVTGKRLIRNTETNLGDFVADAYRNVMNADIGLANGGGIRADLKQGDLTYEDIIDVHPYGNEMCVVEATGQEILDALELGASKYPEENGGFLQVSGLSYTIDLSVPSSVVRSDEGEFIRVNGAYRVKNVLVNGEPLDMSRTYTVASHNYMLKNGGDGYVMFKDNNLIKDCTMLDNEALIEYITKNLDGSVGKEYADPYGQGRITIVSQSTANAA